jgi:phosphatidylserine/phosphatidylglycerophosphate/cardiolipin synthase-like enzyme
MARFINTKEAVSELEKLIRNAGEKLYLVSPYLKLSKDFRVLLNYRNRNDKVTTVIFGKHELKSDELNFLQGLSFVVLYYHEDLHAKCYANDDKMIITSLNLYEFSMANNKEMGVLIDRNDPADAQTFADAMAEVEFIRSTSDRYEFTAEKINSSERVRDQAVNQKAADKATAAPTKQVVTGYCIRTGVEIPFNIEKPFCYEAYKSWRQFENGDYPEKYCHFSGEPSNGETCFNKPILKKNWKKAHEEHG